MTSFNSPQPLELPTRRVWLRHCGVGLGLAGLADLLAGQGLLSAQQAASTSAAGPAPGPLAPRPPHFPARAKRVLHLFMNGGPSHVDLFDPKPALLRHAGRPLPSSSGMYSGAAFPSPFHFSKHGHSGIDISELLPHLSACADDLCVVRSMHTNLPDHAPAIVMMNTGESSLNVPSVGSWVTYGLGTENQSLPAFLAMCPGGYPKEEARNWRSSFLPGVFHGVYIDSIHERPQDLVPNITSLAVARPQQRQQLDLLQQLNHRHMARRPYDAALEARIQSFEMAYRMQHEALEVFDISREPAYIRRLYGPGVQGRQLLIARRLLERGVRFVQLWHGPSEPWDSHRTLVAQHRHLCQESDQATAALLTDLKQRGMLDDTLVIWGGEFGRTPTMEVVRFSATDPRLAGRDHNPLGFTMWLAGGGVKAGHVHGATDELGRRAVQDPVHVRDLHATILHLLGFDHERLTYTHGGRDYRLTTPGAQVVRGILA
jgi:hypothetical protein